MIHDTIKQRLRASLLFTPSPAESLERAARLTRELREDGSWRDLDYGPASFSGGGRPAHLERTRLLAQARRAAPGTLDPALRRALDFWLAHDFPVADGPGPSCAVPRLLGQTALLCENETSPGAWEKIIEILARARLARWVPGAGWQGWTGTALLGTAYNVILRGSLENAPFLFDGAFSRAFGELRLAPPGAEGIQADLSYLAPGSARPEEAGLRFAREAARFIALAHGTPWQAPAEAVKLFSAFLLDAQQWMIEPAGRAPSARDESPAARQAAGLAVAIGQLAQAGNPPRRQELAALAHRLLGEGAPLSGHRYFWRANCVVHQRPGFSVRLRPGPARPADEAAEPALDPARAGATRFLRAGAATNHALPPRAGGGLPGATFLEPSGELAARLASARGFDDPLSGGLSEGDYGLAALRLAGPALHGKKAWFFFDESVACLGSGLRAAPGAEVRTLVDERAFGGEATVSLDRLAPGTPLRAGESVAGAVHRVEHDGIVYDFAGASAVRVSVDPEEGHGPAARFSVSIGHGAPPQGGRYAYTVLPLGGDAPGARGHAAAELAQVEVLANSPAVQAVRHRALRLAGIAFWEAGVLRLPGGGRVAANHPCLLLCREDAAGGGVRLTAASLAREPASVHVEYGGQCLCFDLPGGRAGGRGVSRQL